MARSRWILVAMFAGLGLYVLTRPVEPVAVREQAVKTVPRPEKASSGGVPVAVPPEPAASVAQAPASRLPEAGPLPAPNPPSPRRQSPAAPPLPASQRPAAAPPEPAQAVVDSLALNIRQYQLRFGGNPVGTNAEIVRELTGGNQKGATYLPSGLKRLNDQGELIDEWGTPYFFHQESSERMEIRSAGSDRVLWTADDIVAR
jgi:hypothetical protein